MLRLAARKCGTDIKEQSLRAFSEWASVHPDKLSEGSPGKGSNLGEHSGHDRHRYTVLLTRPSSIHTMGKRQIGSDEDM